jgi:hypothetical protein
MVERSKENNLKAKINDKGGHEALLIRFMIKASSFER